MFCIYCLQVVCIPCFTAKSHQFLLVWSLSSQVEVTLLPHWSKSVLSLPNITSNPCVCCPKFYDVLCLLLSVPLSRFPGFAEGDLCSFPGAFVHWGTTCFHFFDMFNFNVFCCVPRKKSQRSPCWKMVLRGYLFLFFFCFSPQFSFLGGFLVLYFPASASASLLFCFFAFSAFLLFLLLLSCLLLCFSASLLFCFSAFSASLLFCFSAFCFSCFFFLLLCFSCFSALPLLFFSASLLSLLLCFCASVPFYFYYSTFSFLQSCVFAALLPAPLLLCFLSLPASLFFSFLLLYSLLFVS